MNLEEIVKQLEREEDTGSARFASARASDIIAAVKENPDLGVIYDHSLECKRSLTDEELNSVAQIIEDSYVALHRLFPLTPFEQLTDEQKSLWRDLARRCYSNVTKRPEQFVGKLYYEYGGDSETLEDTLSCSDDDMYRPRECVEWYRAGKIPAHRAALICDSPYMYYPIPKRVTLYGKPAERIEVEKGRVWLAHRFFHNGRVVSYQELIRENWQAGKSNVLENFNLAENPSSCYLVEVYWSDEFEGLDYQLQGYALMTAPQLAGYLENITRESQQNTKPRYKELIDKFGPRH